MAKSLEGKTAIVTGASSGIGKASALAFAERGANVVVADLHEKPREGGKTTVQQIKDFGGKAVFIKTDVAKKASVETMVKKALKEFRQIDFLVNDAGVAVYKDMMDTSEKEFDWILGVNLKGIFLCSKAVLPQMLKQKSGVIVNISSGAGKSGFAGLSVYCASKFGVLGLTESLGQELEGTAVKVFAVCPGAVDTMMQHSLFPERDTSSLIRPETVARNTLELCEKPGRLKNGGNIDVYR